MKADRLYPKAGIILLPILAALLLNITPLPSGFVIRLQQARLAGERHQPEIAANNLEAAVKLFPTRVSLWEQAGNNYQKAGKTSDAIRCFKQAMAEGSLSESGWLALGDAQMQAGDIKGAVGTWSEMLKSGMLVGEVNARLLQAYVSTGNDQAALGVFNSWKDWSRDSAGDIFNLGLSLSVTDSGTALSLFSEAGRLDPSLGPSVRIMEAGINASTNSDPPSYRLLLIGRGLGSLGKWQLAATAFSQACQLSPDYAEAWAYLSLAQDQLGTNALLALNKAVALKPDSILIQGFRALYWEHHGQADMALVYLKSMAIQEPENGLWQVEIGNALVQMNDLTAALPYFQNAVIVEPDNPNYWRDLALFSLIYDERMGDVGLPAARQAVVLDPKNSVGLDILGQYFMANQDLLSAERMFLKAVAEDPQYAQAQFHLGLTYLQEGKRQPAFQTLSLAASLAIGQPLSDQIQRILNQNFP